MCANWDSIQVNCMIHIIVVNPFNRIVHANDNFVIESELVPVSKDLNYREVSRLNMRTWRNTDYCQMVVVGRICAEHVHISIAAYYGSSSCDDENCEIEVLLEKS